NNIRLVFTKAAAVPGGANVTVAGNTINVVLDSANVTAAQLQAALNSHGAASALIDTTFSGDPLANDGPLITAQTVALTGGGPSSARDVVAAIAASAG